MVTGPVGGRRHGLDRGPGSVGSTGAPGAVMGVVPFRLLCLAVVGAVTLGGAWWVGLLDASTDVVLVLLVLLVLPVLAILAAMLAHLVELVLDRAWVPRLRAVGIVTGREHLSSTRQPVVVYNAALKVPMLEWVGEPELWVVSVDVGGRCAKVRVPEETYGDVVTGDQVDVACVTGRFTGRLTLADLEPRVSPRGSA